MNVNAAPVPSALQAFTAPDTAFADWLAAGRQLVESELDRRLPPAGLQPAVLHEAMRYATLNGGKRLRGILALAVCESLGKDPARALLPAAALEAFHAYTLVHDDLPCMDDDDLRRGKPATHIRYGEANALLAGDALLTLACQWMAEAVTPLPHPPGALVLELTRAGGSTGVIGGQTEDLAAEDLPPDEARLLYIHTEKTARLIACACRVGAVAAGACAAKVDTFGEYGRHLGLAFQILDDILDATQATAILGKPAGSDAENHKLTTVSLWGLDKSRDEAQRHTDLAIAHLEKAQCNPGRLQALTRHLLSRIN
ncbi:MAG: polyprenyl synthetase family protein [Verrucomicrobia bacterium]|nr:polyprenyl synthetase family protein [Verrucomicrobiota bacterium]MCH8526488.1 polyprenyl synthetase family protein [Kiritimatiellia bacterium]